MQFEKIPGKEGDKLRMFQALKSGRLSHAVLLKSGDSHAGLAFALSMAQYLLCEHKGEDDSCGKCSNCQQAEKLQHPDLHISFPIFSKKGEVEHCEHLLPTFRELVQSNPYPDINDWISELDADNKQMNLPIKECHRLIQKLSYKSYLGGAKVHVLWLPEFLGKEGNSLLKLIEEPPVGTYFLWVTHHPEKILATIQSRMQLFSIQKFNDSAILNNLTSWGISDAEQASSIAFLANGNMNLAYRLSQHQIEPVGPIFKEFVSHCMRNNGLGLADWVQKISSQSREQTKALCSYAVQACRPGKQKQEDWPTKINSAKLLGIIAQEFSLARNQLEQNANARLIFIHLGMTLIKQFHLHKAKQVPTN